MKNKLIANRKTFSVPFQKDGLIHFPYRPVNNLVYIFPIIREKKYNNSLIVIPDFAQDYYKGSYGVVLAMVDQYIYKGEIYIPEFEVGDLVIYEKDTPWDSLMTGFDGKEYTVKKMNVLDVYCVETSGEL